jgi:hypothetical protein
MSSTGASAGDRLLSRVQLVTAKRPNEVTMDLEKIIDELVYRKKKLDLDSPERQLINRILTGLRYSCEDAGGIIEDLDFDWGATVRLADDAQSPRPADSLVLPFRRSGISY